MAKKNKIKALGLSSGGLDSILAAYILKDQGINVEWITFETPFLGSEKARDAAKFTKIPLEVKDITDRYLEMLKNPKCGYGKFMNPCMDCHALMFELAGAVMKKKRCSFLFSGEVAGQRPMSQTKNSLRYVEKNSGFDGYILRPLSAKELPETIPEKQGLVDRNLLLDISGRSRKVQIQLAEKYNITEYPAPAGGCLLTEREYSKRLRDLFANEDDFTVNDLHLLKYGRHFRLNRNTKIIIGRNKTDNDDMSMYSDYTKHILISLSHYPGPLVIAPKDAGRDIIGFAGAVCAGYAKTPLKRIAEIKIKRADIVETADIIPMQPRKVRMYMI